LIPFLKVIILMDQSIFMNKAIIPNDKDLQIELGETYAFWKEIIDFVVLKYPKAAMEWSFPGNKYGWSFRLKDRKRVIIYLLPRERYFKVAFVFGQKAYDLIVDSPVSEFIKTELAAARVYAEGRGIRIDVKDHAILDDIRKLVEIKLSN
jgi:hypothetical protein